MPFGITLPAPTATTLPAPTLTTLPEASFRTALSPVKIGPVAPSTSYVGAIEFSSPLRAMTLVGYGNASRTGSPHRVDQLKLFSEKRYKTAWRTRGDVEAHLELREALHR